MQKLLLPWLRSQPADTQLSATASGGLLSPGSLYAMLTPFPGDRAAWHHPQSTASLATPASDLLFHKFSGFELNTALLR